MLEPDEVLGVRESVQRRVQFVAVRRLADPGDQFVRVRGELAQLRRGEQPTAVDVELGGVDVRARPRDAQRVPEVPEVDLRTQELDVEDSRN